MPTVGEPERVAAVTPTGTPANGGAEPDARGADPPGERDAERRRPWKKGWPSVEKPTSLSAKLNKFSLGYVVSMLDARR